METPMPRKIGNPNIFALCAFGFSLLMLGLELTYVKEAKGAAIYAVLFAGVLEFVAGMWLIAKGESYLASIVTLFGGWLIGYYCFVTMGKPLGFFHPLGAGAYVLSLLPPIAILAIPAFKWGRKILMGAFISLFLLVLFLGLGIVLGSESIEFSAGIMAFVSAFFIWWLGVNNVVELLHAPA